MPERSLTTVSYVLLGFVELMGPTTPYAIKRNLERTLGHFWPFAHAQFYQEPQRLVVAGLMEETRETEGRRRRIFSNTEDGRAALLEWLAEPVRQQRELRDLGLVKLFFGELVEPEVVEQLRRDQIEVHGGLLAEYERLRERLAGRCDIGYRPATIEAGLRVERALIDFWEAVAADPALERPPGRTSEAEDWPV
jgi:DNA-binding PadR family transcriptional regulator